jgi:hypothetical protein
MARQISIYIKPGSDRNPIKCDRPLIGETFDGQLIEGNDSVYMLP